MTKLEKAIMKEDIPLEWFENNLDLIISDLSACGIDSNDASIEEVVESAKLVYSLEGVELSFL